MRTYYQLSEAQHFQLYRARQSLGVISYLIDRTNAAALSLSAEDLALLLSLLQASIPDLDSLPFVGPPQ